MSHSDSMRPEKERDPLGKARQKIAEGKVKFAESDRVRELDEWAQKFLSCLGRHRGHPKGYRAQLSDRSTVSHFDEDYLGEAGYVRTLEKVGQELGITVSRDDYVHEVAARLRDARVKKKRKCWARTYRRGSKPCGEPSDTTRAFQAAPGLWIQVPLCHYHQHILDEGSRFEGPTVHREPPCEVKHGWPREDGRNEVKGS